MKRQTKKVIALTLSTILLAMLMTVAVFAAYPASPNQPTDLKIMADNIIGHEGGWDGNPDVGRAMAFDGDEYTYFDPPANAPNGGYIGVKMNEPYVLKEIRIYPRENFLGRFDGASIYGFNEDIDPNNWIDEFETKATLIWESSVPAEDWEFQIIKEDQFKVKGQAFTHYAYYKYTVTDNGNHGDVAEVELWGVTQASLATPTIEIVSATPEPAAVEAAPAIEIVSVTEAAPAATPAPAAAPATGNASIVFALIAFATTAVVTTKAIQRKR